MKEGLKFFAENNVGKQSKDKESLGLLSEPILVQEGHVVDELFSPLQLSDNLRKQLKYLETEYELPEEEALHMLFKNTQVLFQPVVGNKGLYYKQGEQPLFTNFGQTMEGAIVAIYNDIQNNDIE